MFNQTSRYVNLGNATFALPDGRIVTYKRRRFLPQGTAMPLLGQVTVAQGDRPDLLAARVLGDPEQFWRLCDANDALKPDELIEEPGAILRIALPQG